jgi:hypothetical protein
MLRKLGLIIASALILVGTVVLPVAAASTYSISGKVTINAAALKGVTVAVQGTTFSAVTDGLGNYHIGSIPAGTSGTLVPSLANYSFSPVNIKFAALTASLTAQNFTAIKVGNVFYSLSGTITKGGLGLAGVSVAFSTFTGLTNSAGAYTISNVPAGTRARIIPSLSGYAFTPASISVSSLSGNLVNQNFTASVVLTVSGKITDKATGLPLGGVTVALGTLSAISNATTGAYTIRNVPVGTSGVLTPSLAGKTFTPAPVTITNLQVSLHSQNFVAAP